MLNFLPHKTLSRHSNSAMNHLSHWYRNRLYCLLSNTQTPRQRLGPPQLDSLQNKNNLSQLAVLTEKGRIADATYRIAFADAGYFLYFTVERQMTASQNSLFPCRDPDPHLVYGSLGQRTYIRSNYIAPKLVRTNLRRWHMMTRRSNPSLLICMSTAQTTSRSVQPISWAHGCHQQTHTRADRHTDSQTDRQTDRHTHARTHARTHTHTHRDSQTGSRTDRQTDRQTHPGFVSCKKKNRNAKNMASAGARAYMGV